jgi:prepilin-type N-terminal cleavage/methylation domain-containing protein
MIQHATSPVSRRSGFTLLEVILATALAALLLGGLYMAINFQFNHAQAGRNLIQEGASARALIDRIANDITQNLGPLDPVSQMQSINAINDGTAAGSSGTSSGSGSTSSGSGSNSGSGNTGGSGSSGTPASGSTAAKTPTTAGKTTGTTAGKTTGKATTPAGSSGSSGATSGSSGSNSSSSSSATPGQAVVFNLGVQGDTNWLALYVSRVPKEANTDDEATNQASVSDLRRISYFMGPDGLYRQELKQATSTDITQGSLPPGASDTDAVLVGKEVKSFTVSYLDPQTLQWQDNWDGTTVGSDGKTPVGPPAAIKITLEVMPSGRGSDGDAPTKTYEQVVAIQTANGPSILSSTNTGGTSP